MKTPEAERSIYEPTPAEKRKATRGKNVADRERKAFQLATRTVDELFEDLRKQTLTYIAKIIVIEHGEPDERFYYHGYGALLSAALGWAHGIVDFGHNVKPKPSILSEVVNASKAEGPALDIVREIERRGVASLIVGITHEPLVVYGGRGFNVMSRRLLEDINIEYKRLPDLRQEIESEDD